jgi:hypothetical protein
MNKGKLWLAAIFTVAFAVSLALYIRQFPPDRVDPCQFDKDKYPKNVTCDVACPGRGFTNQDVAQYGADVTGTQAGFCCPRGYPLDWYQKVPGCYKKK